MAKPCPSCGIRYGYHLAGCEAIADDDPRQENVQGFDGITGRPYVDDEARQEDEPSGRAVLVRYAGNGKFVPVDDPQAIADELWSKQEQQRQTDDYQTGYHDALGDFVRVLASGVMASKPTALERFNRDPDLLANESPLERLRYFLSLALNGQDWLDVEPFLDALGEGGRKPLAEAGFTRRKTGKTAGGLMLEDEDDAPTVLTPCQDSGYRHLWVAEDGARYILSTDGVPASDNQPKE